LDGIVFEFLRAGTTEAKAKTDLAAMSTEQKNLYAGERLIGRYGCYACHNVPGFERAQPIGTELTEAGSKLISQLDFGFLKKADGSQVTHLDVEHQRGNWYTEKLKNPRVFDEGRIKRPDELLKMPNFGFREDEIRSIVMVLTSMVKDQVPLQMRDRTDPDIAAGRQLVAEKNCKGCHIIETLGGDIRAVLQQNVQWPPDLNTQGQKTQPEWLRGFLKDPGATQPRWWMDTRMPTFHFTEHEITVIGKYFASLDNVDWGWIDTSLESTPQRLAAGRQLFEVLECLKCHPTSAAAAGNAAGLAPNLGLAQGRLRPEWIVRWLLDPQQVAPNTSMPTFFAVDGATGRRKTQAPNILEGNVDAQIQAIRDHVFSLGGGGRVRIGN
jgi:mono/diheme cytochrome c family protein